MCGESQSYMGRKQAEKATLLQTWTISYEIGRVTRGWSSELGAQRVESTVTEDCFQGAELLF